MVVPWKPRLPWAASRTFVPPSPCRVLTPPQHKTTHACKYATSLLPTSWTDSAPTSPHARTQQAASPPRAPSLDHPPKLATPRTTTISASPWPTGFLGKTAELTATVPHTACLTTSLQRALPTSGNPRAGAGSARLVTSRPAVAKPSATTPW